MDKKTFDLADKVPELKGKMESAQKKLNDSVKAEKARATEATETIKALRSEFTAAVRDYAAANAANLHILTSCPEEISKPLESLTVELRQHEVALKQAADSHRLEVEAVAKHLGEHEVEPAKRKEFDKAIADKKATLDEETKRVGDHKAKIAALETKRSAWVTEARKRANRANGKTQD